MTLPHLFEFMDQQWLPESLAATLREILSCGNAKPFRSYYRWVADEAKQQVLERRCEMLVELGAGDSPLSRLLADDPDLKHVKIVPCDARPVRESLADLEKRFPGRVFPRYEPVDFSQPHDWPPNTLLVLSGTLHHVPSAVRPQVLRAMTTPGVRVLIAEPLRKTLLSVLFVLLSIFPAIFLPLWYLSRPGRLRRFFWCWLVPIAPLMFWWDGLASCLRMWTEREWLVHCENLFGSLRIPTIRHTLFSQMVTW